MNYADYRITLDVRSIASPVLLECKKRETAIRIYITLTEGIKPYTITENCTAVFTAVKPDGNIIFNDCSIDGNFIIYTFTAQTTAAAGMMPCEIRLYGPDNKLLISADFRILIHDAVYDDDDVVESVTEVSTLTTLICEANALIADVNSRLENGDFIPKLSIGVVATLPPGSEAKASFSGATTAPVLNLSIPQGPQGLQGIQGVQGPKGDRGESGIIVPTVGFYTLSVDENGDLWLTTADEEDIRFEYNSETGDLYYITEE